MPSSPLPAPAPRRRAGPSLLLALSALLAGAGAARAQHVVGPPEVVAAFDASQLETPESVAIDRAGNRYVSLALTGEIRKISPTGVMTTHARLPLGAPPLTPCFDFVPIMGALAIDEDDALYVGVSSCDAAARGIYRVAPGGAVRLLAQVPTTSAPNGIAIHEGSLLVADTGRQLILRVPRRGGAATIWADDPLLKKDPTAPAIFPGPNGAQIFDDELYVSVSGGFRIVAIPIRRGGAAGPVRVHATGVGCDDFAFDVRGDLYCGTDPFNTVVRVGRDGSQTPLLTAADGLDGPTATLFGRRGAGRFDLYITNGAFPFFSTTHRPSLMKVRLDVPGAERSDD